MGVLAIPGLTLLEGGVVERTATGRVPVRRRDQVPI